jgi:hypothetical protein
MSTTNKMLSVRSLLQLSPSASRILWRDSERVLYEKHNTAQPLMSHPCPLIYWQILTVQLWRFNVSIGEPNGLNTLRQN